MRFCESCGAEVPEGKLHCPNCGAPTPIEEERTPSYGSRPTYATTYRQPGGEGGYGRREPAYSYTAGKKPEDRVLGTGAFFGTVLLLSLPVLGLLLQIIWACGGTNSTNRRNLARAYLIFSVLGLLLGALVYLAVRLYVLPLLEGVDLETLLRALLG